MGIESGTEQGLGKIALRKNGCLKNAQLSPEPAYTALVLAQQDDKRVAQGYTKTALAVVWIQAP